MGLFGGKGRNEVTRQEREQDEADIEKLRKNAAAKDAINKAADKGRGSKDKK